MVLKKYDPRLKSHDELISTFICGRDIYEEIIEDLTPSNKKRRSRQSWIVTGPRGAGKSHIMTLIYRKIKGDEDLSKHWMPLIFPEEIFKVDSLYRLLLVVFDKLLKEMSESEYSAEVMLRLNELKKTKIRGGIKQKRINRLELARQLLDMLTETAKKSGRKLVLLLENLQYLLRDQLTLDDQKTLRAYLQENPDVLIIVGSALTVFDQIDNYGKPFYHFFRLRSLEKLGRNEIEQFLIQIADFQGKGQVRKRIRANCHHIQTYNLLTGGNPRLILFLYELLVDQAVLSTGMILDKVSELTPYFLDKTRDESQQRKLVLDALSIGPPAQTATEIAEEVCEDQKSISEQLKRLTAEGWIQEIAVSAKNVKRKEVFYALRDYFFRIWYQVRSGDIDESEVTCLAELVTLLFNKEQIREKIGLHCDTDRYSVKVYQKALELTNDDSYSSVIKLLVESSREQENRAILKIFDKIKEAISQKDWEELLKSANKLKLYPDLKADLHRYLGLAYQKLRQTTKSIEHYLKTIELDPDDFSAWFNVGLTYNSIDQYKHAQNAFYQAARLNPNDHVAWHNQGAAFGCLGDYRSAIDHFQKAIELEPDCFNSWFLLGASYFELAKYKEAIGYFRKALDLNENDFEAWYNLAVCFAHLNDDQKAIKHCKKAAETEPDNPNAWYYLGSLQFNTQEYFDAYHSFVHYILNKESLDFDDYNRFFIIIECAEQVFSGTEELYHLLQADSPTEQKLDALGKLVLLGRFAAVEDTFEAILEQNSFPEKPTKLLDFFLEGYILNLLKNGKKTDQLKRLLHGWLQLLIKTQKSEHVIKTRFMTFFLYYAKMVRKDYLSIDFLQSAINHLYDKGITVSTILLELLAAIQDPDTRNAQKWMTDPLFNEIVNRLS